ncbi:hypothetical protein PDIDSM_1395 [Penicillium digitatum]|nr:hypothetical protein PDIDSM_1395 [Penicillium digitatum]
MSTKINAMDTNFTVEWNASKDQALWDILSRPSKGDINWKALAENFNVTLQFFLQQAAWLYDRQKLEMRKATQSAFPGSRICSRAPSRQVSHQKDVLLRAPDNRRTSFTSTTATNQARGSRNPTRTATPTTEEKEPRWDSFGRRPSAVRREQSPVASLPRSSPLEEEYLSSSSSEESGSDDEDTARHVPLFKRFGKFSTHRSGLRDDEDDDEEEDTPAFLPMTREHQHTLLERPGQELSATLRLDAERAAAQRRHLEQRPGPRVPVATESSISSTSSGGRSSLPGGPILTSQGASIMSPQRAAERQNSRKSTASGREASDGTPSMGSFSDLDDASVTQSALEEGKCSMVECESDEHHQALRSRYLQ